MLSEPSITPGPEPVDAGGCEDPTVVRGAEGAYLIFYTGVDVKRQQGALLVAEGPSLTQLQKQRVMLRSEEHTSELQSLMRISYAVFCLKKQKQQFHRKAGHRSQPDTETLHTHQHILLVC